MYVILDSSLLMDMISFYPINPIKKILGTKEDKKVWVKNIKEELEDKTTNNIK